MSYEKRFCNFSGTTPIKERNYSYYLLNNENEKTNSFLNNDNNNLISSNMRMTNIESRLNTMEKMMKYFDEFIHLKEEEKLNNLTSLEISSNIPSNMNALIDRINKLEKEIAHMKSQENENRKIIQNLTNKIQYLEHIISNNNLVIPEDNNKIDNKGKMNCSNEGGYVKGSEELDELIKNKLNEIYSNNKISDMLFLIEDINKIAEDNEFNINEQNENIRKIQNDNLSLIKIVAVHSEKINNIDYILGELTNLKNRYYQILSVINNNNNNEKEEEIFTNEFIAKLKEENNEIQNENDENKNN